MIEYAGQVVEGIRALAGICLGAVGLFWFVALLALTDDPEEDTRERVKDRALTYVWFTAPVVAVASLVLIFLPSAKTLATMVS